MKTLLSALAIAMLYASCSTLHSTTYIPPQQSFELGKNAHDTFSVKVKNEGKNPIEFYRAPLSGGKHSFVTLAPGESAKVKVESNTAVVFNNASADTATIKLDVHGDLSLGMNYK